MTRGEGRGGKRFLRIRLLVVGGKRKEKKKKKNRGVGMGRGS